MPQKDWTEQRKYPRAKTEKQASYRIINGRDSNKVTTTQRGRVGSIGGGGCMLGLKELETEGLHISFNENSEKQNWLAVEIRLLPGRGPIRAIGQVVWYQRSTGSDEYNYDVGIEFKDIREEDRKTIMDFVNLYSEE